MNNRRVIALFIFCIFFLHGIMLFSQSVTCPGEYRGHLQGIATDGQRIYWSFTSALVSTDMTGQMLKSVPVRSHHGDLCHHQGKLYVAVNFGRFNTEDKADSHVYVYDAETLAELAKYPVPELVHGAGGMEYLQGNFYVVGGLPQDHEQNYVYEYDENFKFIKRHVIPSGQTNLGIQTACFAHGYWWFGCYGKPQQLKCDQKFNLLEKLNFSSSVGLAVLPDGSFLAGRSKRIDSTTEKGKKVFIGLVIPAILTEDNKIIAKPNTAPKP